MARDLVLYIATSLDGYIAEKDGDVSWLEDNAEGALLNAFETFYESVDTVIMGHTTFSQIVCELSPDKWPYEGKKCYTATRKPHKDDPRSEFIQDDFLGFVKQLKDKPGKDIWLVGGADIANQFIAENLVDKYIISLIPIILGDGIPLFSSNNKKIEMRMEQVKSYGDMLEISYTRKK
jgi:dihydrofolate reductase